MTFMAIGEARSYPISDGTTRDLIGLIRAGIPATGPSWVRPESITDVAVGAVAYVHSYGDMRRGVVTKVGRTRVTVTFVTQGGYQAACDPRNTWGVKVTSKAESLDNIRIRKTEPIDVAGILEDLAETVDRLEAEQAEEQAEYQTPANVIEMDAELIKRDALARQSDGRVQDVEQARSEAISEDIKRSLTPRFPIGTPEYAEYRRRLKAELEAWVAEVEPVTVTVWDLVGEGRTRAGREEVFISHNRVKVLVNGELVGESGHGTTLAAQDHAGNLVRALAAAERAYRIDVARNVHGFPLIPAPRKSEESALPYVPQEGDRVTIANGKRVWTVVEGDGPWGMHKLEVTDPRPLVEYPEIDRGAVDGTWSGGRYLHPASGMVWKLTMTYTPDAIWEQEAQEGVVIAAPDGQLRAGVRGRAHRVVLLDGQIHLTPFVTRDPEPDYTLNVRPDDVVEADGRRFRAVVRAGAMEFVPAPVAALRA